MAHFASKMLRFCRVDTLAYTQVNLYGVIQKWFIRLVCRWLVKSRRKSETLVIKSKKSFSLSFLIGSGASPVKHFYGQ